MTPINTRGYCVEAYEVEAYRAQLVYSPEKLSVFANFLVDKYGLKISFSEAAKYLKETS